MARSKRSKSDDELPHLPIHLIVAVFLVYTVYPLLWVVSVAFSGQQTLMFVNLPPDATAFDRLRAIIPWPQHFSLANFTSVIHNQPFLLWLFNSAVVAAATTVLGVFLATTSAYAFSRFRFPGRRAGLMSFLVSQMFPGVLMLIPLFIILVQWLGLGSSRIGLVLVYATTAIPFCVWMLKGYFDTIPRELEESALIDGASPAMIFLRIILPLAKPAIAVTALFSFMTAWNEFILAATLMNEERLYTAPVGLKFFVAAGAIITAIPVVVLFMFLQRYLVSGLTAGAVKG